MQSRASQALAKAFSENRGAQLGLSTRTGISATRLSRLARGDTAPNLENSLKLRDDPEIPIDLSWWGMPPVAEEQAVADAGTGTEG